MWIDVPFGGRREAASPCAVCEGENRAADAEWSRKVNADRWLLTCRATVPGYVDPHVERLVAHLLERTEGGAMVFGEPGDGKSTAARLWVRRLCETGRRQAVYISEPEILRGDRETLEAAEQAGARAIDGIGGRVDLRDWERSRVEDFLDACLARPDSLTVIMASVPDRERIGAWKLPGCYGRTAQGRLDRLCRMNALILSPGPVGGRHG